MCLFFCTAKSFTVENLPDSSLLVYLLARNYEIINSGKLQLDNYNFPYLM